MKSSELRQALINTVYKGNTDYIIKVIIFNPKVIVVCGSVLQAKMLKGRYVLAINSLPWYMRLYLKIFIKDEPRFVGLQFDFKSTNWPVIFDHCALIN